MPQWYDLSKLLHVIFINKITEQADSVFSRRKCRLGGKYFFLDIVLPFTTLSYTF